MNFLRKEFMNNQLVRAAGDLEDFLEWLGGDPAGLSFSEFENELPVFERLGLDFILTKDKNRGKNNKRQATVYVRKGSAFLSAYSRISGKRTYSKRAAVVSALLALWELETLRKVNAVKDAFGVGKGAWEFTLTDEGEMVSHAVF